MNGNNSNNGFATQLVGYFLVTLITYLFLNGFSLRINIDNLVRSACISLIISAIWRFAFNRWLWRTKFMKSILGIKIPYIHGRWKGYIKSSFDNFQSQFPIVIEIHQMYRSMHLTYYDERAMSRGLVTKFIVEEGASPKLFCIYRNEPIVASQKKLQIHYGTMALTVDCVGNKIKGVYFNYYLQRKTYGELYIEFESRDLKHAFETKVYT